jgi:hypothetical protein
MFCVFIDFEKSLNTVWTEGLRYKLLMNHINSTMRNVKSRITYDNEFSEILHAGNPCLNPTWLSLINKNSSE